MTFVVVGLNVAGALALVGALLVGAAINGGVTGSPVAAVVVPTPEPTESSRSPIARTPESTEPDDDEQVSEPIVVTAVDGSCSIAIRPPWRDSGNQIEDDDEHLSIIVEGDLLTDVIVARFDPVDFTGFDGFRQFMRNWLEELAGDGGPGAPREYQIDGLNAIGHEFDGSFPDSGARFSFWHTIVHGDHGYYAVVGSTPVSQQDRQAEVIVEIIESFRELDGNAGT